MELGIPTTILCHPLPSNGWSQCVQILITIADGFTAFPASCEKMCSEKHCTLELSWNSRHQWIATLVPDRLKRRCWSRRSFLLWKTDECFLGRNTWSNYHPGSTLHFLWGVTYYILYVYIYIILYTYIFIYVYLYYTCIPHCRTHPRGFMNSWRIAFLVMSSNRVAPGTQNRRVQDLGN